MKFWDESDSDSDASGITLWFNGPVEAERCDCGGEQEESIEYSHRQASRITVLTCVECGKKVHGGSDVQAPIEL